MYLVCIANTAACFFSLSMITYLPRRVYSYSQPLQLSSPHSFLCHYVSPDKLCQVNYSLPLYILTKYMAVIFHLFRSVIGGLVLFAIAISGMSHSRSLRSRCLWVCWGKCAMRISLNTRWWFMCGAGEVHHANDKLKSGAGKAQQTHISLCVGAGKSSTHRWWFMHEDWKKFNKCILVYAWGWKKFNKCTMAGLWRGGVVLYVIIACWRFLRGSGTRQANLLLQQNNLSAHLENITDANGIDALLW